MTKSRVVLVTGGSRGLGAGFVQRFLDDGCRVATFSRKRSEQIDAWERAAPDRFLFGEVDIQDREAVRAYIKVIGDKFGDPEVLVNNAGVAREGLLALLPDADIDGLIALNLTAAIHVAKMVTRRMLLAGWGRVINISSIVGLTGYRGLSVYGATKAALDGFTRALARELGEKGITVNSIAPGYIRTEMTHGLDDRQQQQIVRRTPVGRLGEVADVVGLAAFLASDEAAFITGQTLVIDGGITA